MNELFTRHFTKDIGKNENGQKYLVLSQTLDGKYDGLGLKYLENGDYYTGLFKNDNFDGVGLLYTKNKYTFSIFKGTCPVGPVVYYDKDNGLLFGLTVVGKGHYFKITPNKKIEIVTPNPIEPRYPVVEKTIDYVIPDFEIHDLRVKPDIIKHPFKEKMTDVKSNGGDFFFYSRKGDLEDLCAVNFTKDGVHVGYLKNGSRNGLISEIRDDNRFVVSHNDINKAITRFETFLFKNAEYFGISCCLNESKYDRNGIYIDKDGNLIVGAFIRGDFELFIEVNLNGELHEEVKVHSSNKPIEENIDNINGDTFEDIDLYNDIMDTPFIHLAGSNDEGERFTYYGQIDSMSNWNGLGIILFDDDSFYLGSWRDDRKVGIGLKRSNNDNYTFSTFNGDGRATKGPTVELVGKKEFLLSTEGGYGEYYFYIYPGETLKQYFIPKNASSQKDWKLIKEYNDFMVPDFRFKKLEIDISFTEEKLTRVEGKNGNVYSVMYIGGKLPNLCTLASSNGILELGYRDSKGKRQGFYYWRHPLGIVRIGNQKTDNETNDFVAYIDDNKKLNVGFVAYDINNESDKYTFAIDKDGRLKYSLLKNNKILEEKDFTLIKNFNPNSVDTPNIGSSINESSNVDKNLSYTEKLNELIGLESVKTQIKRIKAYVRKNNKNLNMHMAFYGNPGTGKTEVARLIAGILHEEGALTTNNLIETDRSGLVGQYIGETADKTHKVIKKAIGGVLFIDEAYTLGSSKDDGKDFGKEAIAALLKDMEDYRGKFCVILAGYRDEMQQLFSVNPGFKSRVQFEIDFPNYSRDELREIARLILKKENYTLSNDALEKTLDILDYKSKLPDFANARTLRNIISQIILIQNYRTMDAKEDRNITLTDVEDYIKENKIPLYEKRKEIKTEKVNFDIIKLLSEEYDDKKFRFDAKARELMEESSVYLQLYKKGKMVGEGSGFIISPDGVIATCAHCVKGFDRIVANFKYITRNGNRVCVNYDAKLVGIDEFNDVAVIKAINLRNDIESFYVLEKYGCSDLPPLSNIVMAGYPFGATRLETISFNEGKVQSSNRLDNGSKAILVDLSGRGGNSGSGVIDKKTGRIVGVFSGSITQPLGNSSSVEEINYYRPIEYVWDILKNNSN